MSSLGKKQFFSNFLDPNPPEVRPISAGNLVAPEGLPGSADAQTMAGMVVIAQGLSFPLGDYPSFFWPSEADPFTPWQPVRPRLLSEELGYKKK